MDKHDPGFPDTILFLLALAALVLFLPSICFEHLMSGDVWWHLATGKVIVTETRLPRCDLFSFTFEGKPWFNHEWLSQVIVYLLQRHLGKISLLVLKIVVMELIFSLLFVVSWKQTRAPVACLAASLAAAAAAQPFLDIRPQLFSFLLVALVLASLVAPSTRRAHLVVSILFVWAQMHASALFGLLLVALFQAVEVVLKRKPVAFLERYPDLPRLPAWTSGAALAAVLANPHTIHVLIYPFRYLGDNPFRDLVEWTPPFASVGLIHPFLWVFLAFGSAMALLSVGRVHPAWSLACAGALAMGLHSRRFVPLFAVVSVVPCAVGLCVLIQGVRGLAMRASSREPGQPPKAWSRAGLVVQAVLILGLMTAGLSRLAAIPRHGRHFGLVVGEDLYPRDTLAFMKLNGITGPVFSTYEWGGYIMYAAFPGRQVFIDARADTLYDGDHYRLYLALMEGSPKSLSLLDRNGIDLALLPRFARLAPALAADVRWTVLFEDGKSYLFGRVGAAPEARIKALEEEGSLAFPDSARHDYGKGMIAYHAGRLDEAEAALNRALGRDRYFSEARFALAQCALDRKEYRRVETLIAQDLAIDPWAPGRHYMMGRAFEKTGRKAEAIEMYKKELKIAPYFSMAARRLRRLQR